MGWSRHRDRDSNFQSLETETHQDEFPSCRDQDLLRLDNLVVVVTETHRDWMKIVETETLT